MNPDGKPSGAFLCRNTHKFTTVIWFPDNGKADYGFPDNGKMDNEKSDIGFSVIGKSLTIKYLRNQYLID